MLTIEQKTHTNLADMVNVRIDEPRHVRFICLHNRLDQKASILLDGVTINLFAGPEALQFCRDLLSVAEDAVAWADDAMCDWCEEDVRLADGRYCQACLDSQRPNEHQLADDMERAREARAERGAA